MSANPRHGPQAWHSAASALQDQVLVEVLRMYRATGRKVFLATNSLWAYTHVIMNYVVAGQSGAARDFAWLEEFDLVVTGCCKPAFFAEGGTLFAVNPEDGTLANTDNGAPISNIDPVGEKPEIPSPGIPTQTAVRAASAWVCLSSQGLALSRVAICAVAA